MDPREHWEAVYRRTDPRRTSWYRPHLDRSLELLAATGLSKDAAILDVGGGNSPLVDDLLERGYTDVTVLDLSATALDAAKRRLGERATEVTWIEADITSVSLPASRYDFWHDRAVFHFLTEQLQRQRYVAQVERALRKGGHIVVATFGPEGPERCSGLPVARYDDVSLHAQFGGHFRKIASVEETHLTPWGAEQEFVYCYCRLEP